MKHLMAARTDFSIGESMLQIDHLIEGAKANGYESVTMMDTMSVHGLVDFSNRCKKAGIKPVIGCRIRVVEDPTYRTPPKASGEKAKKNPMYMLKAYVVNEDGVKSLMKLLSKANSEEYFYYQSRVGLADVMALEGVQISTGDFYSVFHMENHSAIIHALSEKFDTYIELSPINTPLFDTLNAKAMKLLAEEKLPPLVTFPTLYKDAAAAKSLDILNCVTSNTKMDVTWRAQPQVHDFYIQEPKRILQRVKDSALRLQKFYGIKNAASWVEGLSNQGNLVAACKYKFEKQPVSLPKMADNEFVTLGKKCIEGWNKRFSQPVLGHTPSPVDVPVYRERLNFELGFIKKMGFAGYFLLVEDLVMWAKNNDIIVGPGRGSVGGSLVAYLIGITDVDPIRFNLIFERFINPDRLDLPDADLDFMSSKRHMVIEYLSAKYGSDRVAGISNYSTLASASALRDTGRVFGLNGIDLAATKLVPKEHGQSATLTEAAKSVADIERFKDDQPEIWGHALQLEGVMRSFGRHAAGVVVAGEPLVNRAVVETRGESPIVNWDKRVVEDWGLVKMDILGLSTLDVLEIARQYVKERHSIDVDYLRLPLEEPDIMDAFGKGDTTGVFQFESPGMKKLLRDLADGGRLTFEDITAATALYRPGPMDSGLMADFVNIKQGNSLPYYDHPSMKPALESTQGVIVYQEQVMQVAVDLAGFTKTEADHLRKAMGKKDKDKMAEMRQKWVDGCKSNVGMDERTAGGLFDKIEAFAGYGFNRSHAVEYSLISYFTMWVRVRYPAEYFAACMSIVKDEKLPALVSDAREYGIEVLPPDINLSSHQFTIPDDKHILSPFSAVHGISENTAQRIVELRKENRDWRLARIKKKRDGTTEEVWEVDMLSAPKGRFDSLEDFKRSAEIPGSKVNARVVENLNAVGAFASVEPTQKGARHPDRRRDQTELMGGLIIDSIKADRVADLGEGFLRTKIIRVIQDYKKCDGCSLSGEPHPAARAKTVVKFMVVSDCPTWQEEKKDKLLEGDSSMYIKSAIKDAGLGVADGYYTTLVKAKKSEKFLTNEQLNGCSQFLNRELELIKPAIIVALGSATIKRFLPGVKSPAEVAGKAFYDSTLDATIVCGINAQQVGFDPDKQLILDETFRKVAEILS